AAIASSSTCAAPATARCAARSTTMARPSSLPPRCLSGAAPRRSPSIASAAARSRSGAAPALASRRVRSGSISRSSGERPSPPAPRKALPPTSDRTSREEHAKNSAKLEEACDFVGAATEALLAGDPRRAAHLAALGGDNALADRAVLAIARTLPREEGLRAACDLAARGFGRQAGALLAELGAHLPARSALAAPGGPRP